MTNATKASAISLIQSLLVQPANSMNKWATDNNPSGAPNVSANPRLLTYDMMAGQTITTYPNLNAYDVTSVRYVLGNLTTVTTHVPAAISSDTFNRNELAEVIRKTAILTSRLRTIRLIKTNYPYDAANNFYDITAPANMNPTFQVPADWWSSIPVSSFFANDIKLSDIINFINFIKVALISWQSTPLTYTEGYCHSNCHSNCHGNRGRR